MKKTNVPDSPATIYNNMSHHYRRLFGAKAVVDSSAPFHLKNKALQSHQRSASTQSLNKLSLCDSNRTSGPCKFHSESRKTLSSSTMSLYSKSFVECPRYKKLHKTTCQKPDILDSLMANYDQPPFQPRILKSNTESKLRHLERVYFPPRKTPIGIPAWEPIETEDNLKPWHRNSTASVGKKLMAPSHLLNEKRISDMGSQYSTSSKDSAYNEGEGNSSNDDGSRGPSPGYTNQQNKNSSKTYKSWSVQKAERRNEDSLYVAFLRDITDDILKKGVYTNKGLKLVFQKHINENLNRLNLNRMKDEVDKLSETIGIPKKDEDDKIDFGLGSNSSVPLLIKHEQPYGEAPSLLTHYARPPTLSSIRQISRSQASSSSLDIEKELEALESYSDVELNEAEILDTLAVLNINPKVLENEINTNKNTKHKPVIQLENVAHLPSKNNKESNLDGNNTDVISFDATKRQMAEKESLHRRNDNINTQESDSRTKQSNGLNEMKEKKGQLIKIKEEQFLEESNDNGTEKSSTSATESDKSTSVHEPAEKSHNIDLNLNKFKEINASLFHDKPSSQQKNKASDEIQEELEETNYSEDDFEQHSDESGDEIEEDINEHSEQSEDSNNLSETESL